MSSPTNSEWAANLHAFCAMINNRSNEHRRAMQCFTDPYSVLSPSFSIVRQELDSMIRVIYLLQISAHDERQRLIVSTIRGQKWTVTTENGKIKVLTDRDMVGIAQQLEGWTQSVYRFGCAFVHLSDFHNHIAKNPFQKLSQTERQDILSHMRYYHGGPSRDDPDMTEISEYLPRVLYKIAYNLGGHLKQLERGETERA